jgi:hypothetical protein
MSWVYAGMGDGAIPCRVIERFNPHHREYPFHISDASSAEH